MKLPQRMIRFLSVCLFVILTVNFMAAQKPLTRADGDAVPNGMHTDSGQVAPPVLGPVGQAVVTGNGINYHGGPVMKGNPVNAYIVWYGNWNSTGSNTAATKSLIEHFLGTIGGSAIEKVNTTYGDNSGNVSGNVRFAGSTTNTSTASLSDSGVLVASKGSEPSERSRLFEKPSLSASESHRSPTPFPLTSLQPKLATVGQLS